jgi:glycosyltransferase involved in cell wall biosynthesis
VQKIHKAEINNKICCIFNLAPYYRSSIYKLMDKELDCDFYIGDWKATTVSLMKYDELKGYKGELRDISLLGNFYWEKNSVRLAFKPYQHYIITGQPHCISTWFILLITLIRGKRTYLWTHGWYGHESFVKKIIKKVFFKLSTKTLLYGDYARDMMIKEGFNPSKLISIYNSLDYDMQCEIRKNLIPTSIYQKHFGNTFPVLVYIGRIQKVKKLDLIIEAIKELKYKGINCNLIIIGKETDDTGIQELVANYKLANHVWFYGACFEEKVLGELIYNADVCVSPGNVGLTAMHSLVYGTPVITHNNFSNQMPEFEAIEEGVTGGFFEENSVVELCNKIVSWISIPTEQGDLVRQKCYAVIREKYNPHEQLNTIKKAIYG